MTEFKDDLPVEPAPRFVPGLTRPPVFDPDRGPMPVAQPGTMLAAVVALESCRDFARAKAVGALLERAR